jgi:hypothetical protein
MLLSWSCSRSLALLLSWSPCAVVGHASLSSVINAVMAQLTSARLQADAAVADMALLYRDDPLLAPFPVSRIVIDSASVQLKVC